MSAARNTRRGNARVHLVAAFVVIAALGLSGCAELSSAVGGLAGLGAAAGFMDRDTATKAQLAVTAVKTLGDVANAVSSPFTPEQEYYIGRSVAATILDQYKPVADPVATAYVNRLGQALALASPRPQLYNGYVFLILDSDEINALSTPGGHIFITRGMIALTRSEDELAAVLAHEISHVALRHGLGSIRSSRVISAVQDGMFSALEIVTPEQLKQVTSIFSDTTSDIVDTLITRGYSGATEREADGAATEILRAVGYDPYALIRVLQRMDDAQKAQYDGAQQKQGFSKTHPRPQARISDLESTDLRGVAEGGTVDMVAANRRYHAALAKLLGSP